MSTASSPSSRRRQEHAQKYWQDLTLPSTEGGSKTKKSRGNRQQQRFRAKLRRQGFNAETIATMTHECTEPHRQEAASTTVDKRKRESKSTGGVSTSLSQMSIAPPSSKRARAVTTTELTIEPTQTTQFQLNAKPDYLNVPDQVFRRMLATSLEGAGEYLAQRLDTPEKVQYARGYAQRVNDLFYLRLKRDFWNNYFEVLTISRLWPVNMPREFVKQNDLHRVQFVTRENVQRRQRTAIDELKQAEERLTEHQQLAMIDLSIVLNRLSTVIPAFVRQGQRRLSADFERRKLLLQFDVNDYHFVQAFYNLKPSEEQIASAKVIWKATVDKQQSEHYLAILKQRIYTKRLPSSFSLLDHSIDGSTEKMLRDSLLHADKRATLSSQRQKTISRFKYDLMAIKIATVEEIIRSYATLIANEKKKLTDTAHGQVPLPKSLVNVLNAIAVRQSNIIKRGQFITKHKLSFFGHAPAVMEEQTAAGTTVGATI